MKRLLALLIGGLYISVMTVDVSYAAHASTAHHHKKSHRQVKHGQKRHKKASAPASRVTHSAYQEAHANSPKSDEASELRP